jgi:hypothetical protein
MATKGECVYISIGSREHTRAAIISQSSMPGFRCRRNRTQILANITKKVIGDRTPAIIVVTLPLPSGLT